MIRVAALAVLAVALAELALRAVGYSSPVWYQPDPELGWTLRPGVSGWFTREGRTFVRINSAGQRDREHALAKPADAYRIAVLGDASSEAMQVEMQRTYWAQLPERLESCGFQRGKRIEVLNFGVRDYGTGQALLMLKTRALRYRPDMVLLQTSIGNDVRDNSFALDQIKRRPFFRLDANGALRLDDSFATGAAYGGQAARGRELLRELTNESRVLQLARGLRQLRLLQPAQASANGNIAGLEVETLTPPRDARWEEAWRITEALIARIAEVASRNGASLALVTVPFALDAHPDAALREALQRKLGVADLSYPERRVAAFAASKGIPAIVLGPQMQARAAASGSYLYGAENAKIGFFHWNELGHDAAADIIGRRLCALASSRAFSAGTNGL